MQILPGIYAKLMPFYVRTISNQDKYLPGISRPEAKSETRPELSNREPEEGGGV